MIITSNTDDCNPSLGISKEFFYLVCWHWHWHCARKVQAVALVAPGVGGGGGGLGVSDTLPQFSLFRGNL